MISFFEAKNEIVISLNDFTIEYINKHVSGKLDHYCLDFIDKFKSVVLHTYLNEIKVDEQKFTIFQIKMRTYEYEVVVIA